MNIKFDIEKTKRICIWIVSSIIVFYTFLILIIPNVINLNKYKSDVQKLVYDNCKLNIDFERAKIVVSPILSVGIKLNDIKISYPDNGKIVSTDLAEVKLAILPLILRTITIDSVKLKNPEINLDILPDDRLKLEKYLSENIPVIQTEQTCEQKMPEFKIKLNKLKISDYKVIFKDSTDKLTIKGDKIILSKVVLNKHASLLAKGSVFLNDKENIIYDINIDTFLPQITEDSKKSPQTNIEFKFNPVKAFKIYDLKLNASSKLKIKNNGSLDIKGFTDVEDITFSLPNKNLPKSNLNLKFSGKKVSINSNLNVSDNEKALVSGMVKYGKKHFVDLSVKTDKISTKSIQELVIGFLDSLAIPHEGSKITPSGYIQADFNLKTNLQNIHSNGYFNIVNAAFIHKQIPASLKNINVNIDFAGNKINIKKCQAYLNDVLFEAKGYIDNKANADININTKNLQIAKLYTAFIPNIKNSIEISSGLLTFNLDIKGKLEKIKPQIKFNLKDFVLKEKSTKLLVMQKDLSINLIADMKGYKGSITETNGQISLPDIVVRYPKFKIDFDDKQITINKFPISVNSSPINISGEIKDYIKKCDIKLFATGNLKTLDILKGLPKDLRGFIACKGQLPVDFKVTGSPQKLIISGNVKANGQNHFSPVIVNNLVNHQSRLSILTEIVGNKLIIKDLGLYDEKNQIVKLTGSISDIDKKIQKIDSIKFSLPKTLVVSTPLLKSSKMSIKGNLDVTGTVVKPKMNGNFNISNVSIPDLKTTVNRIAIALSGTNLTLKAEGANVNSSQFGVDLNADISSANIFKISKLTLMSNYINADKLLAVAEKATKIMGTTSSSASASSCSSVIPVVINSGNAKIANFKMGDIVASNIKGNFNLYNNLLKISDFSLNAYEGTITGNASYNLISTATTANAKGNGINANKIVTTFAKLKDQVSGTATFNANISLKGATYITQMKSLKGKAHFEVRNGQFGSLGKFENFIKAPNIISQSFIGTSIGSVVNTIIPYNSGQFSIVKGNLIFSNGVANISSITSTGSNMALHISGRFNLLNNNTNLVILGRISSILASALGPLSQISPDKVTQYLPKYGKKALNIFSALTDKTNQSDLNKIPKLTPNSSATQEFKVVLNGNIERPLTLIRSFKWLSTTTEYAKTQTSISDFLQESYGAIIDTTASTVVKSVSQNAKVQKAQQNVQQRVQKVQQSNAAKNVQKFGNFLKQVSEY